MKRRDVLKVLSLFPTTLIPIRVETKTFDDHDEHLELYTKNSKIEDPIMRKLFDEYFTPSIVEHIKYATKRDQIYDKLLARKK